MIVITEEYRMDLYDFKESELLKGKKRWLFGAELTELDTPITPKEHMIRVLDTNKPLWLPSTFDYGYLFPMCVPDNPAKGNVSDAKLPVSELGGKDMFGIEWEYVEKVGGSTTRPGHPLLSDANEWPDKVVFPTKEVIDSWDWEGSLKRSEAVMRKKDFWEIVICTGFYERLISFMDFEGAAMAMIDEDQEDAIKALFDRLADLYIVLIDKYLEVFGSGNIDAVCLHDDWGHQRGVFFHPDTLYELIVPYMKKVTDYCRSKGLRTECHSCGKVDPLMQVYIDAGFEILECQPIVNYDEIVPVYGDRLKLHYPPKNAPADLNAPAEEHIKKAREFVDKCISWGNPIIMDNYYAPQLNTIFTDEVYRYSRKRYQEIYRKNMNA
jgi:hypothetical protein